MTMMQETASEVEGELLTVVTGYGELSLQLTLGCRELGVRQLLLHETVQLTMHQSQATVDIVVVTAEIDAPHTRVRVTGHRALNGIYQSVTLSQRKIQTGIHPRSTHYIIQQI